MLHVLRRCCAPLLLCAALGFTLVGCGGSSGGSGGTGRFAVYLSDAPPPGVTAVNITINKVEAHVNGQWLTVYAPTPAEPLNLLDTQKAALLLGTADLPVGHYTQVRLFVSNPSMVVDGVEKPLDLVIPSGDQTGIKVNIDADVVANQVTGVLLDFNLEQSIVSEGNGVYKMKPVIKAVLMVASGTISGTVLPGTGNNVHPAEVGVRVAAVYEAGGNYAVGTTVNTAVTAAADASAGTTDGSFKIWALLPGTYTVKVSLDGGATTAVSVPGVVVKAGEDTAAENIALP